MSRYYRDMPSGKVEGELWGTHARDWAELGDPSTAPLAEAMLNAAGVTIGTDFLDIGCGAGGACVLANDMGANVTGLDASKNLLEFARGRLPGAKFDEGDLEELPYDDASFDVVFAANSVQYAENQEQAVREALRVKKPDGKFVIGMWCENEKCEMAGFFRALAPDGPAPSAPPTLSKRENLIALLQRSGAQIGEESEVLCTFRFENIDEAIRCHRSAGIIQMFEAKLGEDYVRGAIIESHRPFLKADGSYALDNWFRWVVCK